MIISKKEGIAVGIEPMTEALRMLGLSAEAKVKEGEAINPGSEVMRIRGSARKILAIERTLLNVLNHMCGVALATRKVVEKVRDAGLNVVIAATRKTLPGLRMLEKYAVKVGGGDTHRFSLSDIILIKDNHIRILGGIEEAPRRVKAVGSPYRKIEIEVTSKEEAILAAKLGADIIMLDNTKPEEIKEVVEELKRLGLRDKVLLEASGGIALDNVLEYASSGVDIISFRIHYSFG